MGRSPSCESPRLRPQSPSFRDRFLSLLFAALLLFLLFLLVISFWQTSHVLLEKAPLRPEEPREQAGMPSWLHVQAILTGLHRSRSVFASISQMWWPSGRKGQREACYSHG